MPPNSLPDRVGKFFRFSRPSPFILAGLPPLKRQDIKITLQINPVQSCPTWHGFRNLLPVRNSINGLKANAGEKKIVQRFDKKAAATPSDRAL